MSSTLQHRQYGFSVVAVALAVVVLAVLGFAAVRIMDQQATETANDETTTAAEEAPQVNDSSDLQEAEEYVKDTDVDSTLDTSEIDNALNE